MQSYVGLKKAWSTSTFEYENYCFKPKFVVMFALLSNTLSSMGLDKLSDSEKFWQIKNSFWACLRNSCALALKALPKKIWEEGEERSEWNKWRTTGGSERCIAPEAQHYFGESKTSQHRRRFFLLVTCRTKTKFYHNPGDFISKGNAFWPNRG